MMTLSKIAKLANVSVSTASKAFSMSSEISPETRELVFAVAKEHGCFKKFFNAKYPKPLIAIVCPEFGGNHYADYLYFLHKHLSEENCEICVATTNFSTARKEELITYYDKYSDADGIILIGTKCPASEECEIPIVTISSNPNADVILDIRSAMEEIAAHLLKHNIASVGFIGEYLTVSKLRTFQDTMTQNGIPVDEKLIAITDKRFYEGGYDAMAQLLALENPPRAVVCAYDSMAIGAARCITERGLRIPEDVAIVGIDDIACTPYLNPPLASVSYNKEEVCKLSCRLLLDTINGAPSVSPLTVKTSLHLRNSFLF